MIFTPGLWYIDMVVNGAFFALRPKVCIESHLGSIMLPPGADLGPRFIRMSDDAQEFAGQSDGGMPGTWRWRRGSGWIFDPRIPHGDSGLIYDRSGNLLIIEPGAGVTSQGFRYVDDVTGLPVLADDTIVSSNDISAYTRFSTGVEFGQARFGDEALVCFAGGKVRTVYNGPVFHVRARRDGNFYSVCAWQREGSVRGVFTYEQLASMQEHMPAPLPVPVPVPVPTPIPTPPGGHPVNETPLDREILKKLQEVRETFPNPLQSIRRDLGNILTETVKAFGPAVGLETKPGDNTAIVIDASGNEVTVGKDIIRTIEGGQHFGRDFLAATGSGVATPYLGDKGPADPARFFRSFPSPVPTPIPTPVPTPPPVDDVTSRLIRIEAKIDQLLND